MVVVLASAKDCSATLPANLCQSYAQAGRISMGFADSNAIQEGLETVAEGRSQLGEPPMNQGARHYLLLSVNVRGMVATDGDR